MFTIIKKVLILVSLLVLAIPLYVYAQNEANYNREAELFIKAEPSSEDYLSKDFISATLKEEKEYSFWDFINKKAYAATIDKDEERRILREKWKKLLRLDIFYPYFKIEEVEDWVSEKASVEFFNIQGRPKFEGDQIKYIFKIKF